MAGKLIFTGCLALAIPHASALQYEVIDLGTLGGDFSYASHINDLGQIVGYSETSTDGVFHAYLYSGGTMHDLGTLGGADSSAWSLNGFGQTVGYSLTTANKRRAFLYSGGTMQDLGTLGGDESEAFAINNAGQIVGSSRVSNGIRHAFLYSGGTMQDLGTLGGDESEAFAINSAGQIVGWSYVGRDMHAFLYSGGTMQDLGTLGGRFSYGLGINDAGQSVGFAETTDGKIHAFLHSGGGGLMYDLNALLDPNSEEWELTSAKAINSNGWIVGQGYIGGQERAFLARPVPEPAVTLPMAVGLGAAILRRRKK